MSPKRLRDAQQCRTKLASQTLLRSEFLSFLLKIMSAMPFDYWEHSGISVSVQSPKQEFASGLQLLITQISRQVLRFVYKQAQMDHSETMPSTGRVEDLIWTYHKELSLKTESTEYIIFS
jgi:hypothetical protein